jgi:hypothetical protein
MWEMPGNAGVKRCYGIVGDAWNPVIDALRRNGKIEFVHVRHEEYGVFARGRGGLPERQSGGGMRHGGTGRNAPLHGLMDARKEGAAIGHFPQRMWWKLSHWVFNWLISLSSKASFSLRDIEAVRASTSFSQY